MGDSLLNFQFDSQLDSPSFEETKAEATATTSAAAADTGEASNDTPSTPIDLYRDFTPEEGHAVLQQDWGADYEANLKMTEHAAQEIFKDDPESLQLLSSTLGNNPALIKLGYRIACMLNGSRPQRVEMPSTQQLDAALDAFRPGGSKYDQWLGGDSKLNEERIRLYSQRYRGKVTI